MCIMVWKHTPYLYLKNVFVNKERSSDKQEAQSPKVVSVSDHPRNTPFSTHKQLEMINQKQMWR